MKTLNFNFSHPFKGNGRIDMPGKSNAPGTFLLLDSKGSNLVEIPLSGFHNGKYNITLDWELDHQYFVHRQEFEITDQPGQQASGL
jgi:hypothetical protein